MEPFTHGTRGLARRFHEQMGSPGIQPELFTDSQRESLSCHHERYRDITDDNLGFQYTNYAITESTFGVDLLFPVDQYQKSTRSAKYAFLIIILTFVVKFLRGNIPEKNIHPVQYLLVGLALCLFYTLLVSTSEHIGFTPCLYHLCSHDYFTNHVLHDRHFKNKENGINDRRTSGLSLRLHFLPDPTGNLRSTGGEYRIIRYLSDHHVFLSKNKLVQ